MTTPANTAVRERRRRSTPLDIEQMDIMKALTAAEYSRRQFVLNFAASRNTKLLIPGQKADKTKEAEERVVQWMNENGYSTVTNDHFKYTVDERLWTTLVGTDIPFPFSFMRQTPEVVLTYSPTNDTKTDLTRRSRPKSEAFLPDSGTVEIRLLEDNTATSVSPRSISPPKEGKLSRTATNGTTPSSKQLQAQQTDPQPTPEPQRRGSLMSGGGRRKKKSQTGNGSPPLQKNPAVMSVPLIKMEKKRSMSLTSLEELKLSRRASTQERFPFLVRWSRSWGRRTSA